MNQEKLDKACKKQCEERIAYLKELKRTTSAGLLVIDKQEKSFVVNLDYKVLSKTLDALIEEQQRLLKQYD